MKQMFEQSEEGRAASKCTCKCLERSVMFLFVLICSEHGVSETTK